MYFKEDDCFGMDGNQLL
ncbi:Protein of unknown function [Bacillus mycoides]|nr:Protein of unknown function [Bacillus mycoides]